MKTPAYQPLHLPLLSGTMTALLLSGIAIASLAISAQGFDGILAPAKPVGAVAEQAGAVTGASKCAECGVIESIRRIDDPGENSGHHAPVRNAAGKGSDADGKPAGSYAITIRLQDGSTRTVNDTHPAKWRPGERVTLISGLE